MGAAGWVVNSIVVAWTCLVFVMYSFPTVKPVTAQNMSEWTIKTYPLLGTRESEEEAANVYSLCLFRLRLCSISRHGPCRDGKLVSLRQESLSWTERDSDRRRFIDLFVCLKPGGVTFVDRM